MAESREPTVQIGRTPSGGVAVETPKSYQPPFTQHWGDIFNLIGSPATRYGRLEADGNPSVRVKLLMLCDPIIRFTMAYVASKLVKAEYEIQCPDDRVGRFFEVMYANIHKEFMLQASMAVAIGYLPLIKQLRFEVPKPSDPRDEDVWDSSVTPFILTGFDMVPPAGAYPRFESKQFRGFHYSEGDVDRMYALWLTIGRHMAFGDYGGWGRLRSAYKPWWLGEFSDDQMIVYMQKNIDRALVVDHPTGKSKDGLDYSEIAASIGNAARAGATITLPSEVHKYYDGTTETEKLSNVRLWNIWALDGTDKVESFISNWDHLDARKALGLLVPRQVHSGVKQEVFGGPTSAKVLGQLSVDMIIEEAEEIDWHLNLHCFPYLASVNFGAQAPAVVKRTVGLNESDRDELFEIVKILLQIQQDAARNISFPRLANELGLPPAEPGEAPPEEEETPPEQESEEEEEEDVDANPYLRDLYTQIADRFTAPSGHAPERIEYRCPVCGAMECDRYADHGGLCVCVSCGSTFDPELE